MLDVLILLELYGKDDFSSPFFTRCSLKLLEFVGEFSSFIVIFCGRFSYFFNNNNNNLTFILRKIYVNMIKCALQVNYRHY